MPSSALMHYCLSARYDFSSLGAHSRGQPRSCQNRRWPRPQTVALVFSCAGLVQYWLSSSLPPRPRSRCIFGDALATICPLSGEARYGGRSTDEHAPVLSADPTPLGPSPWQIALGLVGCLIRRMGEAVLRLIECLLRFTLGLVSQPGLAYWRAYWLPWSNLDEVFDALLRHIVRCVDAPAACSARSFVSISMRLASSELPGAKIVPRPVTTSVSPRNRRGTSSGWMSRFSPSHRGLLCSASPSRLPSICSMLPAALVLASRSAFSGRALSSSCRRRCPRLAQVLAASGVLGHIGGLCAECAERTDRSAFNGASFGPCLDVVERAAQRVGCICAAALFRPHIRILLMCKHAPMDARCVPPIGGVSARRAPALTRVRGRRAGGDADAKRLRRGPDDRMRTRRHGYGAEDSVGARDRARRRDLPRRSRAGGYAYDRLDLSAQSFSIGVAASAAAGALWLALSLVALIRRRLVARILRP